MYYSFNMSELPKIKDFYCITRDTLWQITEKSNILIFITAGSCIINLDGKDYILKKDDFFFIPANHSYTRLPQKDEKCTMIYIHFDSNSPATEYTYDNLHEHLEKTKILLNSSIMHTSTTLPYQNTIYLEDFNKTAVTDKITGLLTDLNQYYFNKSITSELECSAIFCHILSILSKYTVRKCLSNPTIKTAPNLPKNLSRAISFIRQNYTTPISLTDLADYCSVSKQQLIRYFKAEFSKTPTQFITDYKISQAKNLLYNHPYLSIGEIATELGFDNQHYFSKVFTKTTGETPTHYRERTTNFGKSKENE